MITSAKNYIKKKQTKKPDRQKPRTNGKSKAIQAKSHKEAYTYTLTKREKGKKYIYIYVCMYIYQKEESNQAKKQIHQ